MIQVVESVKGYKCVSLWPTWVSNPAPAQYVQHVTVDIRRFGYDYEEMDFMDLEFTIGTPSRQLLMLLKQYFANGAKFLSGEKMECVASFQGPEECKNTLDTLTVNYVPRDEGCESARGPEDNWTEMEDLEYHETADIRGLEYVVGKLANSGLLSRRVRQLCLIMYGELRTEWDIR